MSSLSDIFLAVLALFLPPLVVVIKVGCSRHLLINIILDFLGWIPGVVHAWYIIFAYPDGRQRRPSRRLASRSSSRHSGRYFNAPLPPQQPAHSHGYYGGQPPMTHAPRGCQ
ncbi:UPF0057-domain-containing protein [Polychaeton citri CBS 116435]|uniref:UPF0057-domain-containing protein n=1 Tax=Polychaeton citri CBS 116435 TaxID=1314669 RepID=A0A9P4UPU9_9PEZI|nr:UPF0057-domain-containing protein [Polychaeton citri CBS 116435]